jgi:hypothetical protein
MKQLILSNKNDQAFSLRGLLQQTIKKGILLLLLIISMQWVQAQAIKAAGFGSWNNPATWEGGVVPTAADDVIIGGSLIVTVDDLGAECNSLQLGDNDDIVEPQLGKLEFSGSSSLTVTGTITMGNIDFLTVGTITMSANATLTCASIIESDPLYSAIYETNAGTIIFTENCALPFNLYQFNNLIVRSGITTIGRNLPIEGNLTIENGGTLDLGENTANRNTIAGVLTIDNGGTLRIGGGGTIPANFNSHVIGSTSTIEYYGVAQTVATLNSSQNYGNLIISSSLPTSLKEVNGTIGIAGNLTINSGIFSTSTFSSNRISVGGTMTVANGATLRIQGGGTLPNNFSTHSIGISSTIEYSGTVAQIVAVLNSGQKYGNLNVFSEVKTLAGSITVAGTIGFAGTPNKLVIGSNTLTLEGTISGSLTGSRNFSGSSTSNMIINGALDRTLFFDATTPGTTNLLNNFTINHNGNVTTLGNDLTINNALTFTAGKLSLAARILTLRGNIVNTVSGGIRGSTSSRLLFNGSVSPTLSMDQTTVGTTNVLSTLQINSSGQVVTMGNDLVRIALLLLLLENWLLTVIHSLLEAWLLIQFQEVSVQVAPAK